MTKVLLVRHGETDWNREGRVQGRTDILLNHRGVKQAEYCRRALKDMTFDCVVSSPLARARETAAFIAGPRQIIVEDAFIERHYGMAEGLTIEECRQSYPDRRYPYEETLFAMQERVMRGLHKLHEEYLEQKVLVVTHGGVINGVLAFVTKGTYGSGKTRLSHGGLTDLECIDGHWIVHQFNVVNHLDSKEINLSNEKR
ncbi:histidine phosphatase family protein [Bacillaceae bacterium SIJ1]|uniref:histidine phosphatase family protein n=1 Tax=Litoribacterium kuwaitense TaxID=1398745 RepID=UPI0013EE13CE|nr:histidine phosphatase family protein [Litoribacterium kuwaitense]NGP46316.1 histidine phosphatase family protein [Litoribacterium kuwaitense]